MDEADIMLDMGFLEDVDKIAGRLPKNLQMLVFSATIPEKLKPFLKSIWKIQSIYKFHQHKQRQQYQSFFITSKTS